MILYGHWMLLQVSKKHLIGKWKISHPDKSQDSGFINLLLQLLGHTGTDFLGLQWTDTFRIEKSVWWKDTGIK